MPRKGDSPNRDSSGPFRGLGRGLQQLEFPPEGPLLSRNALDDDPRVLAGGLAADINDSLG